MQPEQLLMALDRAGRDHCWNNAAAHIAARLGTVLSERSGRCTKVGARLEMCACLIDLSEWQEVGNSGAVHNVGLSRVDDALQSFGIAADKAMCVSGIAQAAQERPNAIAAVT